MVDTLYLEKLIEDKGLKKKYIAERMTIPYTTFYRKIRNESEFSHAEALLLFKVLNCTEAEAKKIFCV